jgi:hypothetical protein
MRHACERGREVALAQHDQRGRGMSPLAAPWMAREAFEDLMVPSTVIKGDAGDSMPDATGRNQG